MEVERKVVGDQGEDKVGKETKEDVIEEGIS